MKRRALPPSLAVMLLALVASAGAVFAQDPDGPALTLTNGLTQAQIEAGDPGDPVFVDLMRTLGLVVFTTPFNTYDGLGDGPFDPTELPTTEFGHRPTLQGNGLFLRMNGLDAQSCNECHGVVSSATLPPELGVGGAGALSAAAMPAATLVDLSDSFDDRISYVPGHDPDLPLIHDGVADFNGRFINPPFLFGGGGVELLAREMTADLQDILDKLQQQPAGVSEPLTTHGVNFGTITSLGSGGVRLDLDGVGFLRGPTDFFPGIGSPDPAEHLVVRPFGRKGDAFTMRDFDRNAMQFHFGMQPEEVLEEKFGNPNLDEDDDGIHNELTVAEMTVLHIFSVTNPPPFQQPQADELGSVLFDQVGCADCHIRNINTRSRKIALAHPEVPEDPSANVYWELKLSPFGFQNNFFPANERGVRVPLFSDLKRHKMGPGLEETCEGCGTPPDIGFGRPIPNDEFITARLWGIADTAPYMHDGRATTLWQAIDAHGGDAGTARSNFLALSASDQEAVIKFLKTLRTPNDPNVDILP